MFESTTGSIQRGRANPTAGIVSVLLHAALFGALILVAVLQPEVVEEAIAEVEVTFFSAPPPPPPPPPPPASSNSAEKKKKKKKKKPEEPKIEKPKPDELVQPDATPEDIPEEEPEDAEETDDEEEVADGGQVGGVEGGVAGGKVGGQLGGEIGGKIGGEIGGDIHSLGLGDSKGQCKSPGSPTYPEMAKENGIQGTVLIEVVLDERGKPLKAKDERCSEWQTADKQARRKEWHPMKCIHAISGPQELYYDTLMHYSSLRCRPWLSDGKPIMFRGKFQVIYKLQGN